MFPFYFALHSKEITIHLKNYTNPRIQIILKIDQTCRMSAWGKKKKEGTKSGNGKDSHNY